MASFKNRKSLLIVLVALLIAGGVGAYFLTKNNNDNNSNTNTSQPASTGNQSASSANSFAPATTTGLPFVATITTTGGANNGTATMSSDGKGNTSYVITKDGSETKLIYTADAYYLCSGTETCIKYPASQSGGSGFDPSSYQYDASKVDSLKSSAAYKGQQSCPTGTCDVWSVGTANATSTVFVDTKTKYIAQVTSTTGGVTNKITYQYKAVTITPPANATTLPTQ